MNPILWTPTSTNRKTGDVPTGWVGTTSEASIATCKAVRCSLLSVKAGGTATSGPLCYAQHGTPAFGHASVIAAHERGADRSLDAALKWRAFAARMVRVGAIGDPGAPGVVLHTLAAARRVAKEGLAFVGYTHGWRRAGAAALRGIVMASCDYSPADGYAAVDEALARGWRAVTTGPADAYQRGQRTPGGAPLVVCPAMVAAKADGRPGRVTCNDCRLCDASKPGPVILFPDHGPTSQGRRGR